MEPTIFKPGAYKSPGIYKDFGTIYNGNGVYNSGFGNKKKVSFNGYEYEYKQINNLLWITSSLRNPTTNSFSTPYGENAGLLYPYIDFTEISSILHDNWRIPTKDDFIDLLGSIGAVNSKPYISETEGGTNETGFNALLTGYINQNGQYTGTGYGYIWANTEYSYNLMCTTEYNINIIHPNDAGNKSTTKQQIRLCKEL